MRGGRRLIGMGTVLALSVGLLGQARAGAATTGLAVTSTIAVGNLPDAVAVDQSTHDVYIADLEEHTVSVVNGSGRLTDTIDVGAGPEGLAVDSSNHNVYVANTDDNTVSVIANGVVTTTIAVGGSPDAVAVDPTTHSVYVANLYNVSGETEPQGSVSVINHNAVTDTIPVSNPEAIAVDPSTHEVYAVTGSTLTEIVGDVVTGTVPLGDNVLAIAVDPISHNIYVTKQQGGVSIVHDNIVTATIGVGALPCGVAVDPANHNIYVANDMSDSVSVIDESGDASNGTVTDTVNDGTTQPGGNSYPCAVAVDLGTHAVYVANQSTNTLSVIGPLEKPEVAPTITGSVGAAVTNQHYSAQFTVTGYPVAFVTVTAGSLPPGFYVSALGQLAGSATTAGTYNFTLTANNGFGTASVPVHLTVTNPVGADVAATITAPPSAADGSTFTEHFTVTNHGPGTAVGVATNGFIPQGLYVISAPGATQHAPTLEWADPSPLAPGTSITYPVTFKVGDTFHGTATLGGVTESLIVGTTDPDPDVANNVALTTIRLG